MAQQAHKRHDRGLRTLFQHPRVVADLLRELVHEPWTAELDLETLEALPTNYISGLLSGQYEERASDIVWKVRWRDPRQRQQPLYAILLLELQSRNDPGMALRILVYVVLFYQRLLREDPSLLTKGGKLPPVCAIVFYNGDEAWTAPLDMADLIDKVPASFAKHLPAFSYCLIDEKRLPLEELVGLENVAAAICRAERNQGPEALAGLVSELVEWLKAPEQQALRRDLTVWLTKVVLPDQLGGAPFPEVSELDEFKTILEVNMQTWSERWYSQGYEAGTAAGEEKGLTEGRAESLLWFLRYKFGDLEPTIETRVRAADAETLLRWRERLANARNPEEVLAG